MASVMLFSSCGFFDTEEVMVPAYIYVDSVNFRAEADGSQGDSIQEFPDVWIANGGITLGTIGIPALIPVQRHGLTQIELEAGIVRSGQYNERVKYPFIAPEVYYRNLRPGVSDTFRPVFKYLAGTKFRFVEDYDKVGTVFEAFPNNDSKLDSVVRVSDQNALVPGRNSGKVIMNQNSLRFGIWTRGSFTFAAYNSPAYLEMDYTSNLNIQLNLYYPDPATPGNLIPTGSLTLLPTNKGVNRGWNKVYFDLSKEIQPNVTYQVFIGFLNPDHVVPDVYIDNIKLVTF